MRDGKKANSNSAESRISLAVSLSISAESFRFQAETRHFHSMIVGVVKRKERRHTKESQTQLNHYKTVMWLPWAFENYKIITKQAGWWNHIAQFFFKSKTTRSKIVLASHLSDQSDGHHFFSFRLISLAARGRCCGGTWFTVNGISDVSLVFTILMPMTSANTFMLGKHLLCSLSLIL